MAANKALSAGVLVVFCIIDQLVTRHQGLRNFLNKTILLFIFLIFV
jgi:hypothetical protein